MICDLLSREQSKQHYAPGTEFQIGKIEMVANTGTYLDSPLLDNSFQALKARNAKALANGPGSVSSQPTKR